MKTTASRASAVSQTRGFGDLLYDKAGARPSLDLDFAGTSSLRDKITGENLVDHTRSSNATYIDSDGLVREAPFNVHNFARQFSNITTTEKDTIANPEGTVEEVYYIPNEGNLHRSTGSGYTGADGDSQNQMWASSVYMRTNQGTADVTINVNGQNSKVVTVTDQWQRFSTVQTTPAVHSSYKFFDIRTTTTDPSSSWYYVTRGFGPTFGGTQTTTKIYVWGAQLEKNEVTPFMGQNDGAPRFTHERVETGNLLHASNTYQDWTTAPGSSSGTTTVIGNQALAPDGTYSAFQVDFEIGNGGTSNDRAMLKIPTVANALSGKPYTASVYLKTTDGTTKVMSLGTISGSSTSITVTGEWQRFENTSTPSSDLADQPLNIRLRGNEGTATSASVYVWGAQAEQSESASTFVPSIDTFTSRASNATYVDSAGLIKTAYKNEVPYSEDFTNWTNGISQDSVVSNVAIAPDGTQTADKLIVGNYNHWAHAWQQSISPSELGTLSVYAKYIEGSVFTHVVLGRQSNHQYYSLGASFNLTNGTIHDIKSDANGDHCTASIENVGNGWYRCSVSPIPTFPSATRPQSSFYVSPHRSDNSPDNSYYYRPTNNYGNGTDGLLVWGAMQNNNVTEAGDYVKTGATASGGPRYSHDPETLTPTGLYLEPQGVNYAKHLTSSYNAPSDLLNPSGGYGAFSITSSNNQYFYLNNFTPVNGQNVTVSYWAKLRPDATINSLINLVPFRWNSSIAAQGNYYIDLSDGTLASVTLNGGANASTATADNTTITPYPNGWYRITHRIPMDSTWTTGANFGFTQYAGGHTNARHDVHYTWGFQVEIGDYATSYIQPVFNSTASVTRAADVYTSTANLTETFEPRGLLIEEARTNLLHYSSNPVNNWNSKGTATTVTENYATAPDGTNTAVRIQMPATSGTFFKQLTSGFSSGTVYTASFWGKSNGQPQIDLIGGPGGTATAFTLSDRWERYTLTWTSSGTAANFGFDNGTTPFAVDALVWGMQVEAGSFATSYIPTNSNSSATRSADIVSISGDNFGTYRTNKVLKTEHIWDWTVWNPVLGSNESSIKVVTPYAYPNPIDGKYNAALVHRHSTDYYFIQNINVTYPLTIGYSIYVKPVSNPCIIQLFTQSSQQGRANFDLINKTHGGDGTRNITEVGDGWLKLEWTTPTHTSNPSSVSISLTTDSLTTSRGTGTGTNVKFYVYAPQVEDNSITNYIPSTDTFTSRLGKATYVDSNGLIKTAYRNLVVYSNEIGNNLGWIKSNLSATVNNSTAPDGTQTATLLIPNTTNTDSHFTYQTVGYQNGAMSLHVKSAGMSHVSLIHQPANAPTEACGVSVNLNNGTIHATDNATGEIIDEGNGWYRVIVKPTTSVQARYFIIQPNNGEQPNDNNRFRVVYAGNGTDGVYVWGAMQTDNANDAGEYTANLTNVLSGAPRYSHDPETLVPTGLYLEPAVINYAPNNIDFSNKWTLSQSTRAVDTNVINPDGTNGANYLTANAGNRTGNNNEPRFKGFPDPLPTAAEVTAGVVYSCFVKKKTHRYVILSQGGTVRNNGFTFDFDTESIVAIGTKNSSGVYERGFVKYPNGWYRLYQKYNASDVGGGYQIWIPKDETYTRTSESASPYTYEGTESVYFWGAQIETGNNLSSFIYNETDSSVTRPADSYTSAAKTVFDRDGGNKEAWYNHYGPQTYLLEHQRPKGDWKRIWIVGTDNNNGSFSQIATQVFWRGSNTQPERQFIVDAGIQFQFMPTLSDQTHNYKYGVAMDVNDAQSFDNGALTGTDTSVILPTGIQTNMPDKITIGVVGNNPTTYMSSPFARITYWKTRLPNTSLIQISNK